MSDARVTHLFRYGADMDPAAILAAHPGARFVARAWVPAGATVLPPLPEVDAPPVLPGAAVSPPGAVWGVLLRLPDGVGAADRAGGPAAVEATTDDGRRFAALIAGDAAVAEPAAVLAAARYWELPPLYVRRLVAWAGDGG